MLAYSFYVAWLPDQSNTFLSVLCCLISPILIFQCHAAAESRLQVAAIAASGVAQKC